MYLQAFPAGPLFTNSYIIACDATKEAAIIDAAPGSAASIEKFIRDNNFQCKHLLLTHSHWDHIADTSKYKELFDLQVHVHALDLPNLEQPGADQLPCPLLLPSIKPDLFLDEATPLKVGELLVEVIHTPGHSPGSVCFYVRNYGVLISGDTLFKSAVGNISFPTSRPELMASSLAKLQALPEQTKVFPGHGPTTSILSEQRTFQHNMH